MKLSNSFKFALTRKIVTIPKPFLKTEWHRLHTRNILGNLSKFFNTRTFESGCRTPAKADKYIEVGQKVL